MPQPDVIVVGGGVVGVSCARALARANRSVSIIDAGPKPGSATQVAAGMLAPLAEAAPEDPMLGLSVRARDFYLELAPELFEETGVDIGLWTQGVFQAAFTEDEVAQGKSKVARQRQSGFTAEWLSPEEVQEQAPGISEQVLGAAFAPEDGALEPLALLEGLTTSAIGNGAELVRGDEVVEVLVDGDAVTGVRTAGGTLSSGAVIVAAGAWSGRLAGLPRPLTVEPIRGQIAALDSPEQHPRTVIYGAGGYVLQRGEQLIAGTTMENAGFDASVTDDGISAIQAAASQIFPSLVGAPVVETWAGLRPQAPDGRPIIGPDPQLAGLWYATGHGRNGILLAAYTGDILAHLHEEEQIEHDLSCVIPGRFWSW